MVMLQIIHLSEQFNRIQSLILIAACRSRPFCYWQNLEFGIMPSGAPVKYAPEIRSLTTIGIKIAKGKFLSKCKLNICR